MKTDVIKDKDRDYVLREVRQSIDPTREDVIVNVSTFYDPIDEMWTAVICYYE